MRLYKTTEGIILEELGVLYKLAAIDWDTFINNDNLFQNCKDAIQDAETISTLGVIQAPIGDQELWACGVTYYRSKIGRQEESGDGGDFYAKVYEAERPEVFFKATKHRISAPNTPVRIRKDSTWNVPEPELTLVVTSSGKIVGYTIGNDMSSRSIEGENPLYLPQAKTYDGCASVGPCIFITESVLSPDTLITLEIIRDGNSVFSSSIEISQMKRTVEELVSFVYKECSFPNGCLIMTGTGIVPEKEFTLAINDEVRITISNIGTLANTIRS